MDVDRSHIRAKALVVLLNPGRTAHAVMRCAATTENPRGFHRFVGGTVELGERAEDALQREVREELDVELRDVRRVGLVQNIFSFNDELAHEIVFLYAAESRSPLTIPGEYVDNGEPIWVEWRPVDDTAEALPLYPDGTSALVRSHVISLASSSLTEPPPDRGW